MTSSKNKLSKNLQSKYLVTGSIIAFAIAASPYIFYMYEIFPDGRVWENSFFTYKSNYYENVLTAFWTYFGKITPLYLLLIWFFTCKHWWYHVILVPLAMYAYQIVSLFYQDAFDVNNTMDSNQLIYQAPFFLVVLVIVYLVRIQIFDRIYGIDLSELNETDISVFNNMSTRDKKELSEFDAIDAMIAREPTEDYYRKL
jgi:hypothetical protein